MTEGILGVLGSLFTVLLYFLKWRSSPEEVTKRAIAIRHLSDEDTHEALLKIHQGQLEALRAQMDKLESDVSTLTFRVGMREKSANPAGGENH